MASTTLTFLKQEWVLEEVRSHSFPNLKGKKIKEKELSSYSSTTTILNNFLLTACPRAEVDWAVQGMSTTKGNLHLHPSRRFGWQWWNRRSCSKFCASPVLCIGSVPWSQSNSSVTFRSHLLLLCLWSRTDVWEAAHQSKSSWHQQFSVLLV